MASTVNAESQVPTQPSTGNNPSIMAELPNDPAPADIQAEQPRRLTSLAGPSARPELEMATLPSRHKPNDEENPPNREPNQVVCDNEGRLQNSAPKYPFGYPRVAGFMACGANSAIFRKFDRMAYATILQQQAQLLIIEREIDDMNAMDVELLRLHGCTKKKTSLTAGDASKQNHDTSTAERFNSFLARPGAVPQGKSRIRSETTGQQKWVHLVYKMQRDGHGNLTCQSYTALRGIWEAEPEGTGIVAFSLVFPPNASFRQPILVLEPSINASTYTRAASWEMKIAGPRIQDSSPGRRSHVGADFDSLLWAYADPDIRGDCTERTVHMFARWGASCEHDDQDFFLVARFKPALPTKALDAGRLPHIDGRKSDAGEQGRTLAGLEDLDADFFSRSTEFPNELVGPVALMIARRYDALRDAGLMAKSRRQENIEHVNALNRLELLLANYRSMLLQHMQLARSAGPNTRGLTALRQWFWDRDESRRNTAMLPLQGLAIDVYTQRKRTEDLVAIGPPTRIDKLSWLIDYVFASWLKKRGEQPMQNLGDTYIYAEDKVERIASGIGVVLAAGLLIGAIVGLDQLEDKAARLGTICALTVAFALVLVSTTTSTKGEVFGASAAYAAVLVVYVGGTLDK